jgi:hypothetical protein
MWENTEVQGSPFMFSRLQKYTSPLIISEVTETGEGNEEYCEILYKWTLLNS